MVAQDMIALPIGPRQRSAIVASPGYFEHHPTPATPQDLQDMPCIRFRFQSGRYYDWEFERRSEEHTSELQSQMRNSYATFCSTTHNNSLPTLNVIASIH